MKFKQILLSALVIVTFVIYSWQQRHESSAAVVAPSTRQTTAQPSQSTSEGGSTPTQISSKYNDGSYTGTVADAFYGNIEVQATISRGKITDIKFLQYPNDQDNSIRINQQADPLLKQEAIRAQNASVDIISGATDTSQAFIQSLGSALQKAQVG